MSSQEPKKETKRLVCLLMGFFVAAVWAAPLVLFKFIIFKDQYMTSFIAVLSWCVAVNGVALLLNMVDKILACCHCKESRVPEAVLHVFTIMGGAPGTVIAMFFCLHKFSKASYQLWFIVFSSLSITFVFGAFGLAYGLEWYHQTQNGPSTPFNATTTVFELTTSQGILSSSDEITSSGSDVTTFISSSINVTGL